jgi:hypothetical protein
MPGMVATDGTRGNSDETAFNPVMQHQAIKKRVGPAPLAGLIAFVASDDAAMITGQTIICDGGWRFALRTIDTGQLCFIARHARSALFKSAKLPYDLWMIQTRLASIIRSLQNASARHTTPSLINMEVIVWAGSFWAWDHLIALN